MAKLDINQVTILTLFSDKKADFLIPDYQRPYAWEEAECQTLWDDIFSFAFPNDDYTKFDTDNDEYFLGPIVTFKNQNNKMEIIDGQQRLTTLMLLLRAFYERFGNMQDANSIKTRENLEKCIWKTDEFGTPDKNKLKIDSEVATDNDKDEFLAILKSGNGTGLKSQYSKNYLYFQKKINDFLNSYPSFFSYLPIRILNNCILLPIEADSQDTALRIFSTLNDRGMPLSDADIFKAQFYKYYTEKSQKDTFIKRWKQLEETTNKIFHPISGTPMDELFTRYMYYERSLQGIKSSTTEALRKFYEKNSYALLKKDETLNNLEQLVDFWNDVLNQNNDRFSEKVLKRLFVLNYAPNGMWTYIVSVYFMHNKNKDGMLEDDSFYTFLNKITAFIWTYAITNPGVNALRTPVYAEMINIVTNKTVEFNEYKFDAENLKTLFYTYAFTNIRPITKSLLTWWAFNNEEQELLKIETALDCEHIFSRKRQEYEKTLLNSKSLESLGNKSILEQTINIRASDYKFTDKIRYYNGFTTSKGKKKEGTKVAELLSLAKTKNDFTEKDIEERNNNIISEFIKYLSKNNLLKQ